MLTVVAIEACGAGLQAGGARPARATAALPVDRITGGPVRAGADLAAVVPVCVGWAGLGAAGALAARRAEAGPAHSVTGGPGTAVTGVVAVHSEEAGRAGTLTEGSPPAGRAGAGPADMVTGCSVLTLALLPTAWPIVALGTPLLAPRAHVAGLTRAQATDGIAAPMACAAVADVAAVRSPVPTVTGSLAAETGPPRGAAAAASGRVAVSIIGAGAPRLAARPKPACWASILAAAAGEARAAQAGSRLGLTGGTMLTRRADLLTAQPPAALGTLCPTVIPGPPRRAQALPRDRVAGGPPTGAGARAVQAKCPRRALLATVLPPVAGRTLLPTLAADGVTGHARGAGARLQAPRPKEAQPALVLAPLAPEACLAGTGAILLVTRTRVLPLTLTLLRAARPKGPRRTGEVAEAAVEPWITEAGPVEAVAPTPVGTVAFLTALLAIEAFGAAVLTVGTADTGRAEASPSHRVTGPAVLTAAGEAAVLPEAVWRTSLVAEEPGPALGAVTAVQAGAAGASVPAVVTGQAAVLAKGVVQADKLLLQCVLAPCLCLFHLLILLGPNIVVSEEVGQLVLEHRDMREGSHEGQMAVQPHLGHLQVGTAPAVLIQPVADLAGALEGAGQVGAVVLTAAVARGALVHILTPAAVSAETVASIAAALVAPRAVGANLLAARGVGTVVNVNARLLVLAQLVTVGAGADGPLAAVAAAVGAAAVGRLTAVHYLHLDPVALPAISAQLVARVAHTLKGALGVEAAVGTLGQARGAFIHIFAGLVVRRQPVARVALAVGTAPEQPARVHAPSIPVGARVSPDTALAVLLELELRPALAAVLAHGELNAVVLAAAVAHRAGVDGQAGPAIGMESEAGFALAEVGAWGVHTPVLAAAVVHLALIHILAGLAVSLQLVAGGAAAVEAPHSVAALALTAPIVQGTLVHVVLTAGTLEASGTVARLGGVGCAAAAVKAEAGAAFRGEAALVPGLLAPPRAAPEHGLGLHSVHLAVA